MKSGEHGKVEALVAELRRGVKAGDATRIVAPADARELADELSRLLQSSHRLRAQNAKLRRRIERLKAGLPDAGDDAEE